MEFQQEKSSVSPSAIRCPACLPQPRRSTALPYRGGPLSDVTRACERRIARASVLFLGVIENTLSIVFFEIQGSAEEKKSAQAIQIQNTSKNFVSRHITGLHLWKFAWDFSHWERESCEPGQCVRRVLLYARKTWLVLAKLKIDPSPIKMLIFLQMPFYFSLCGKLLQTLVQARSGLMGADPRTHSRHSSGDIWTMPLGMSDTVGALCFHFHSALLEG